MLSLHRKRAFLRLKKWSMMSGSKIKLQRNASSCSPLNKYEVALADEIMGQLSVLNSLCLYIGWSDVAEQIALALADLDVRKRRSDA